MNVMELFKNPVVWVPATAWLIAQILKTIINAIMNKKLSLSRLIGDGGMPSGHSATVTALATMCALRDGFGSVTFGISVMLAIIVMHDALGVRREAGKQAESIINIAAVINDYVSEHDKTIRTDKLKVLVGHTPLQVVCGSILGCVVAVGYHFIF